MGSLLAQVCLHHQRETGADGAEGEMMTRTLTGWTSAESGAMARARLARARGEPARPSLCASSISRRPVSSLCSAQPNAALPFSSQTCTSCVQMAITSARMAYAPLYPELHGCILEEGCVQETQMMLHSEQNMIAGKHTLCMFVHRAGRARMRNSRAGTSF